MHWHWTDKNVYKNIQLETILSGIILLICYDDFSAFSITRLEDSRAYTQR